MPGPGFLIHQDSAIRFPVDVSNRIVNAIKHVDRI